MKSTWIKCVFPLFRIYNIKRSRWRQPRPNETKNRVPVNGLTLSRDRRFHTISILFFDHNFHIVGCCFHWSNLINIQFRKLLLLSFYLVVSFPLQKPHRQPTNKKRNAISMAEHTRTKFHFVVTSFSTQHSKQPEPRSHHHQIPICKCNAINVFSWSFAHFSRCSNTPKQHKWNSKKKLCEIQNSTAISRTRNDKNAFAEGKLDYEKNQKLLCWLTSETKTEFILDFLIKIKNGHTWNMLIRNQKRKNCIASHLRKKMELSICHFVKEEEERTSEWKKNRKRWTTEPSSRKTKIGREMLGLVFPDLYLNNYLVKLTWPIFGIPFFFSGFNNWIREIGEKSVFSSLLTPQPHEILYSRCLSIQIKWWTGWETHSAQCQPCAVCAAKGLGILGYSVRSFVLALGRTKTWHIETSMWFLVVCVCVCWAELSWHGWSAGWLCWDVRFRI